MASARQLVVIMFTDIVGYTALMGEDEQRAFDILNKNRTFQKPLIEAYGGRWIKELGDGVLACFNTVSDAVNAGIKIQQGCNFSKEFQLRIGIHLGEVLFENNDVFGDAVNIASRLQALAPIGGIWISESVYKNISNKKEIQTKFVREERLKNVREPVQIYEVFAQPFEVSLPADAPIVPSLPEKSIAVLPFVDMSPGHDQEYLGDGLAEEMINVLSQLKELKVIGRTSSFSFKGTNTDLRTIGKALHVNTILEGSVQKAGNRIRITAQLINAEEGYHIWSQRYDREMDDIFVLQDDICSQIATHLKLTLLKDLESEYRPTQDLQAYELFLKGDFHYKKYTPEGFEKAIGYFKRAVELDPSYAEAWSYLGIANFETHGFLYLSLERLDVVRYCVQKALSLQPTNANAHYLQALLHLNTDLDWEKIFSELALGNKYNTQFYHLSFLPLEAWVRACYNGDFDFASRHFQKGLENDPLNIEYQYHLALVSLYCFREYHKTRNILKEIMDLGFPEPVTWGTFCLSYLFDGEYELAEAFARKNYKATEGRGHGAANLIISLAASGKKEEAERLYDLVKETLSIPEFPEYLHARVNAWLNRKDDAFHYLNKAIEGENYWLFTLGVSPEWDPLRKEPRFQEILRQLNFPEPTR